MAFDLNAILDGVRQGLGNAASRGLSPGGGSLSAQLNNSVSVNPAITVIGGSGSPGVSTSGSPSASSSSDIPGYGSGAAPIQADLEGFAYDIPFGANTSSGLLDDLTPEMILLGVAAIGAAIYFMKGN